MGVELINELENVKIKLIEGIINRNGTYDKPTFDHLFDFHASTVKMFVAREVSLKNELDEIKFRMEGLEK